jgi:hypothetical protein
MGDLLRVEELLSLDFDLDFDLCLDDFDLLLSLFLDSFEVDGPDSFLVSFVFLSLEASSSDGFCSAGIGMSALITLGKIDIGFTTPICPFNGLLFSNTDEIALSPTDGTDFEISLDCFNWKSFFPIA